MVPVRHIAALLTMILALPLASRGREELSLANSDRTSLFAQSAAEAINSNFPDRDISFLLLDARTGRVLASRWENPEVPIPLGSLVKPFTALAYGESHDFHYPRHNCRGTATGCWRPAGHGEINLTAAIAYSCNSYFRLLTSDLSATDVWQTATHFNLEGPEREASGAELAGLGVRWKISPLHMAHAYVELIHQRQNPAVAQIIAGMAASARRGTGIEVGRALPGRDALVKTGTAVCTHTPHAPGDGFTVVLVPADDPKILLMVRVHGVPGSQAAKTAGQILRRIED
jgi:cell division protein FtsI/penicillin-binding protein 2